MLFIEHDMELVFRFASRIIVMVGGSILLEGTPDEIAADPRVREVYLGKAHRLAGAWLSRSSAFKRRPRRLRRRRSCSTTCRSICPSAAASRVLGRNGVGKSTLLLTLMGFTQLRRGRIVWRGKDITRLPPHRRARAGIGWVAQEREIFANLTVEENLTVAARPGRWDLPAVYELFPRLAERRRNFGQPAVRRRAADAGDRARADDQSGAAAARRAARRAGADHRRGARRGASAG